MRKIIYILTLMLAFSCEKENDLTMDFKITGVNDKTVVRGESFYMEMEVFYLGGEPEEVTVSFTDLPAGISAVLENATGEPDLKLSAFITADANVSPAVYPVTVMVQSKNKQLSKVFGLTVTDPANILPVVTLAGPAVTTWTLDDPYIEFGYMATDAEDGDLTSQVVVLGTVNYDTAGVYQLKYYVTDSDGESDTATRTVTVLNSLYHIQGQYSCTTEVQGGPVFYWISDIIASPFENNNFILTKISDCFGTLNDPMAVKVITNGTNLILPPQIEFGLNSTFPSHCEAAYHAISGSGTLNMQVPYTFVLNYTDLYEDSTGLLHTFYKKDTYVKVL